MSDRIDLDEERARQQLRWQAKHDELSDLLDRALALLRRLRVCHFDHQPWWLGDARVGDGPVDWLPLDGWVKDRDALLRECEGGGDE